MRISYIRRVWLASIGLLLLVGSFFAIRSITGGRSVREVAPVPADSPDRSAPSDAIAVPVSSQPSGEDESAVRTPLLIDSKTTPAAAAEAGCVVRGSVVDELDRPLEGVQVRLEAYKVWADGSDVPRLPGRSDLHGWELRTDASGSFRFETPLPTAKVVSLKLTSDDFHDSAWERFGTGDARMRTPLHAGENDVGVIRLVATGAIRGNVVDEAGNPIPEARLRIADSPSTTLGREGTTDASGQFVIAAVKAGSYGVNAECTRYLSEFKTPFVVATGAYTGGVDFVLRTAPVLGGTVLDPQRHPLAGAKLWGRPSSSGAGAGGVSAADGSFTIYLPKDEPYGLEVELEGYAPFGRGDRSHLYSPGSKALELVLEPLGAEAKLRFAVVDAKTGKPIERFGFEVELERGEKGAESNLRSQMPTPAPADHPRGEFETLARPGVDLLTVVAPGYRPLQTQIRPEDSTPGAMVVRMSRASRLIGRAMIGSEPAAGAEIRLEAGMMITEHDHADSAADEERFEALPDGAILSTTGADGRFALEVSSSGTHRLVVRTASGHSATRVPLQVESDGDTDLGDLSLEPSGAIAGRVLVPASRQPAGLPVYLDEWQRDQKLSTDAEGRFRFERVPAGAHTLFVGEVPGLLAGTEKTSVTVEAGHTLEVVLDARERGTCTVSLTIDVGKAPAEGLRVTLYPVAEPNSRIELGRTDASGRVSSWARASGPARIQIMSDAGTRIVHPTALVQLDLDAKLDLTVPFEVGSACFELPESFELPARVSGTLKFSGGGNELEEFNGVWFQLVDGTPTTKAVAVESSPRRLCFALLPVGDREVQLELVDPTAPPVKTTTANGFHSGPKSILSAKASLHVRAGESCSIKLP